jgi:hypothetical protein
MLRLFGGSILGTVIGLLAATWVGYAYEGTTAGALSALFLCFVLSLLEVSISFDNAVVNAVVLKRMTPLWQRRFLTWGILVAVFGMRLVLPVVMVAALIWVSPWEALVLAATDPPRYAEVMLSVHHEVAAFGGAFLMLVATKYFLNAEKEEHWLRAIEVPLARVGRLEAVGVGITLGVVWLASTFLHTDEEALGFFRAGVFGILAHLAVSALEVLLHHEEDGESPASASPGELERASAGMFVYLEVLDASFSFDGVVGAFAVTNNLFLIAIGLGIGALFVRSLTIMMVERGTLGSFRFLEHGAFYAVWALSFIMFLDVIVHVPELVAGLTGVVCIGSSVVASRWNARTTA